MRTKLYMRWYANIVSSIVVLLAIPTVVMAADLERQSPNERLPGHESDIYGLAFSGDGKLLVSGGADGLLKLWNVAERKLIRTLAAPNQEEIFGLALSADGKTLAARCKALSILRLWNLDTGETREPATQPSGSIESVAISADGRTVAVGQTTFDNSARVLLYDAETLGEPRRLAGHTGGVFSVAFSHDGTSLASASDDGTVIVWDVASGEAKVTLSTEVKTEPRVEFSPDDRLVIASGGPKTVKVFEANSGELVSTFAGHRLRANCLAVTPSSKMVASGDSEVIVWNSATGEPELKYGVSNAGRVGAVAISADGNTLAWCQFLEKEIFLAALPAGDASSPVVGMGSEGDQPAQAESLREWRDSTGLQSIQATLLEIRGDFIRLRREDGREFTTSIERFSEQDRQYVETRRKNDATK